MCPQTKYNIIWETTRFISCTCVFRIVQHKALQALCDPRFSETSQRFITEPEVPSKSVYVVFKWKRPWAQIGSWARQPLLTILNPLDHPWTINRLSWNASKSIYRGVLSKATDSPWKSWVKMVCSCVVSSVAHQEWGSLMWTQPHAGVFWTREEMS